MKKYNLISICLLSGLLLTTTGCGKTNKNSYKPGNVESSDIQTGYTMSYPTKVTGALHNRGMGWITLEEQTELGKLDLGANGDLPEIDNVGIQTCWDFLEPEEGVYNWDLVDETIDYWTARGKRINFRICTDSLSLPEVYVGAPRWLNEEPYNVDYYEYQYSGNIMARVNNLADETYQYYFERFLKALSDRYVNNPYLDSVDIRGYGMYGEWHSGYNFTNMEERMFTLAYIVDKYAENFAKEGIDVFLSNSWEYQGTNKDGSTAAFSGNCDYYDYLRWSAFDNAMKYEYLGYRRDGMSGNGVTKYSTDERALSELIHSGKRAVNCGEFFQGFNLYIDGVYGMDPVEAVEELFFKSRSNYSTALGWVNSEAARVISEGYEEVFNRGNEIMGYKLKVDEVQYPKGIKKGGKAYIKSKVSNSGVGKFNLPNHSYQLMLIDPNGKVCQTIDNKEYDLRTLLSGETLNIYTVFEVNNQLVDGKYTLACAIVDGNSNPSIRLAQVGNYDEKIYPLGEINVGNYKELNPFYEKVDAKGLSSYSFKGKSNYEVTMKYTPSFELNNYVFGDDDGFKVSLTSKKETLDIEEFKDVSGITSYKTVTAPTGESDCKLSVYGTGKYDGKISVSVAYIEDKTGYFERFEGNYNLLSVNSAWYSDNDNAVVVEDEDRLSGTGSILINGSMPHGESDGLFSDPSLLKIKANSSYTISFKEKGYVVGGNAAYYYIKMVSGTDEQRIAEWYDRPDDPLTVKSFTFITPNWDNISIVFGVKNSGAYIIDDLNVIENYAGSIVVGENVEDVNNTIPVNQAKLESGYVEGFEDCKLADDLFMAGFNRWGHLTNNEEEVISGALSFSSKLDPLTYPFFFDSNWFEFMYSNTKYAKLAANTSYTVRFKYKLMDHSIYLNTDASTPGFAYILGRSVNRVAADSPVLNFAQNIELNTVYELSYTFTTGDASDYRVVIGLYGVGNLIIDDISITKN